MRTEAEILDVAAVVAVVLCLLGGVPAARGAATLEIKNGQLGLPAVVAKQNVYAELEGAVEYVACCPDGKTYESLFVADVDGAQLYDALEKLGARPGAPATEHGAEYRLPTGAKLRIEVSWSGPEGPLREPIEYFVTDVRTGAPMRTVPWAFTGSREARDPDSGKTVLEAKLVGNLISLHQLDPTVLIQNASEAGRDDNRYKAAADRLPAEGTPVVLWLSAVGADKPGARPASGPADRGRRVHLKIRGLVQGVGFRAFTRRHALRLGVRGWVRNLASGEVELVAEGAAQAVSALEQRVGRGPRGARVDAIEAVTGGDVGPLEGFRVLPTPEE